VGHYMLFDLIWFVYHFSPHNWMAFVRLNKRHVRPMLCYVKSFLNHVQQSSVSERTC